MAYTDRSIRRNIRGLHLSPRTCYQTVCRLECQQDSQSSSERWSGVSWIVWWWSWDSPTKFWSWCPKSTWLKMLGDRLPNPTWIAQSVMKHDFRVTRSLESSPTMGCSRSVTLWCWHLSSRKQVSTAQVPLKFRLSEWVVILPARWWQAVHWVYERQG